MSETMSEKYSITKKNIMMHELIGLKAKVIESTDKGRIGLCGTIVDETKNTIVIECEGKEKVVPKKEAVLEIELGGDEKDKIVLDCRKIIFRPEDRTKMCWRKT